MEGVLDLSVVCESLQLGCKTSLKNAFAQTSGARWEDDVISGRLCRYGTGWQRCGVVVRHIAIEGGIEVDRLSAAKFMRSYGLGPRS